VKGNQNLSAAEVECAVCRKESLLNMQQISLNEDQREQFGALQAQFQGHRKQLTSVAAQVPRLFVRK